MAQSKKVQGVATSIREENGYTVVRYHKTDVVRFNSHTVELNTGGWRTPTTKLRMNQAAMQFGLGYKVWQSRGSWFVEYDPKPEDPSGPYDYQKFEGDKVTIDRRAL